VACSPTGPVTVPTTSGRNERVPNPTGSIVTRWRQDPFALGSYSFLSVDSIEGDRELLAAPVGDRLFFAGEATSSSNPATVHGALMSGRDAAAQIADVAAPGASVAVIGAGAAGLGAARDLTDVGFEVVVYEARDRIGGRVNTDTSLGVPIDLGASWIHGIRGNPLTAIAESLGAPMIDTDYDSMVVYDRNGARVPDAIWAEPIRVVNGAARRGLTIEEAINEAVEDKNEKQVERFDFAVVATFEHEYAADVAELSAVAPHEGDYFGGGDVTLPDGYLALLEPLADGIEIQLTHGVDGVTTHATGVTLESAGVQTTHDHCVVTLPLGVMKTGAVQFDPPLPAEKQAAMKRFGMGLLDKVVLEFPEIFWDRNYEWFGYVGPDRGAWSQWFDLTDISGRPMLVCFHAGRAAEIIESKSDDEVVADAMAVLRSVFG
jgi:monoamine oxidase